MNSIRGNPRYAKIMMRKHAVHSSQCVVSWVSSHIGNAGKLVNCASKINRSPEVSFHVDFLRSNEDTDYMHTFWVQSLHCKKIHFTALDAKLKEFSLTLTQNGPQAPSFLTVCIETSAASKYGLPDTAMSLVIHSYGDANEDTCENFGPHFNPFGVSFTLYRLNYCR